jgi:hypothetical protein
MTMILSNEYRKIVGGVCFISSCSPALKKLRRTELGITVACDLRADCVRSSHSGEGGGILIDSRTAKF